MEFKDYYKILGVDKNSDKKEIRKKYRKLARKYHPDLNKGNKDAEKRFKEVQEAYEVLSDPKKREQYDKLGSNWDGGAADDIFRQYYQQQRQGGDQQGFGGQRVYTFHSGGGNDDGPFSDFFKAFFGNGAKGSNVEDIFSRFQGSQNMHDRSGEINNGFENMRFQNASNYQQFHGSESPGESVLETTISLREAYSGTQRRVTLSLNGNGTPQRKTINAKIPPGVRDGSKVRIKAPMGQGTQDVYLKINIAEDSQFTLKGNDVVCELPIRISQAINGDTLEVPTLSGKAKMKIPPGTTGNETFRLKGKGMPGLKGGNPGDQLVKVKITLPKNISDEVKAKLSEVTKIDERL